MICGDTPTYGWMGGVSIKHKSSNRIELSQLGQDLFYQLQQSCGQGNIFTPVCHSVHGGGLCLNACWDTNPPDQAPAPRNRHPQGADTPPPGTPQTRHPRTRHPPRPGTPQEADSSIWSTSGQYASYWNAFLLNCYWFDLTPPIDPPNHPHTNPWVVVSA